MDVNALAARRESPSFLFGFFAFFISLLLHSLFLEIIYRLFQERITVCHT